MKSTNLLVYNRLVLFYLKYVAFEGGRLGARRKSGGSKYSTLLKV